MDPREKMSKKEAPSRSEVFKLVTDEIDKIRAEAAEELAALKKDGKKKMPASNGKNLDLFFKGLSILLTLVVLPTFGWVWSTQGKLAALQIELKQTQNELASIQSKIPALNEAETDLRLLQQEITYLKEAVASKKDKAK